MSQKSPAFQFYVRDWILSQSVMDMTGDQVKAYLYLLSRAWLQEPRATLPNDMEKLAFFSGMTAKQWANNCDAIMSNFKLDKKLNRWTNEKLLSVSKLQEKNSMNRKKGWDTKKNTKRSTKKSTRFIPEPLPMAAEAEAEADIIRRGLEEMENNI